MKEISILNNAILKMDMFFRQLLKIEFSSTVIIRQNNILYGQNGQV